MPAWHPRMNTYPVGWLCRNGRWGEPYAYIRQYDTRRDGKVATVYHLHEWRGSPGPRIGGDFWSGDDAAQAAWDWHLQRSRRQPNPAPLEGHRAPGKANTPARTERD